MNGLDFRSMAKFSVLLSVYAKEKTIYMQQCFDSIYQQTLLPDEVVLVEDGQLTEELYKLIAELKSKYNNLKVVSYPENKGLGYALNWGLQYCTHDIVARMDTDDICFPNRFQRQVEFLLHNPDIDIVGAWIDEFVNGIKDVRSTRMLPELHADILNFAKYRNPMNHPVVMFRKAALERVGGYQPFYLFEDYFLWVRLLMNGSHFYNIPQSLLYFRQTEEMFDRRGGVAYCKSEFLFQYYLYKKDFISILDFIKNISIRTIIRLIPNKLRRIIYIRFLRL